PGPAAEPVLLPGPVAVPVRLARPPRPYPYCPDPSPYPSVRPDPLSRGVPVRRFTV
ncbi:hypothetical protein GA0115246_107831, partial [Streptomyces sp. SolWspMP-sol7th]